LASVDLIKDGWVVLSLLKLHGWRSINRLIMCLHVLLTLLDPLLVLYSQEDSLALVHGLALLLHLAKAFLNTFILRGCNVWVLL
jgi:hypothetical protein